MTTTDFLLLLIFTAIFGSIMGALFTTFEYRIRNGKDILTSKCYCTSCNHELALWFQFPIISFLVLRGKCYYCHNKIPFRYPLIELGFTSFYIISFISLYKTPILLMSSWFIFIIILFFIRIKYHFRTMIKGLLIIFTYHIIYGSLICIIIYALSY
jgi:leader peptidase (prepilin peptidase)/N-methyltransferase